MNHKWCNNTPSTAVAKKADNVLVNTHIWDARITVVTPSFTPLILSKFRQYVLTHKFRALYKEFITCMSNKHNSYWTKIKETGGYSQIRNFGGGGEGELGKDPIAGKKIFA